MSDSDSRTACQSEQAALTVVDLVDALRQAACRNGGPIEQEVLANLLRVSACKDLPETLRALAGRLVADHLARNTEASEGTSNLGHWLLH